MLGGVSQNEHNRRSAALFQQRNALDVVGHREAVHDPERKCDPLRSRALMRPSELVTCGNAVWDAHGRRRPGAGDCESKRAQSEPSRRRAPTGANVHSERTRLPPCKEPARADLRLELELASEPDLMKATPPPLKRSSAGRSQWRPDLGIRVATCAPFGSGAHIAGRVEGPPNLHLEEAWDRAGVRESLRGQSACRPADAGRRWPASGRPCAGSSRRYWG